MFYSDGIEVRVTPIRAENGSGVYTKNSKISKFFASQMDK